MGAENRRLPLRRAAFSTICELMRWWMPFLVLALAACSRSEPTSPPAPTRSAAVGATAPASAVSPRLSSPTPAASPIAGQTAEDEDEDEPEKPLSTDFEIDANASSYSSYVPKTVALSVRPLNGKAPYSYVWNFGDGSIPVAGDYVVHTFTKPGNINVFVTSRDANGETATQQLLMFMVSREDWARRRGLEPASLPSETPWSSPTPDVTPLPPDFEPKAFVPSPAAPQPFPSATL